MLRTLFEVFEIKEIYEGSVLVKLMGHYLKKPKEPINHIEDCPNGIITLFLDDLKTVEFFRGKIGHRFFVEFTECPPEPGVTLNGEN